jgi:predicted ATPase
MEGDVKGWYGGAGRGRCGPTTRRCVRLLRFSLVDNRLLTLVGTGGVGKTRLAVRVADTWRLDGENVAEIVSFVDLASLLDPDLVPETLAAQLGLREQPGRAVEATLVDAIQNAAGLLILDNCAH